MKILYKPALRSCMLGQFKMLVPPPGGFGGKSEILMSPPRLFSCRVRDENGLGLAELFHGFLSQFPVSVAAGLHAAEGHVYLRAGGGRVNVDQAGLDVAHRAEAEPGAFGEDGS